MITKLKNIQEMADELKEKERLLILAANEVFRDKSISLDDRWSTYLTVQNFLPVDSYMVSLKTIGDDKYNWYDDFSIEKYETVYFVNIIDTIKEELEYSRMTSRKSRFDDLDVAAIKEEILSLGSAGFIFDW